MSTNTNEQPSAENPEKLSDLKLSAPKKWAAGLPAVLSAFKNIFEETGPIPARGIKGLFKMNQKGGFDCSSCAWPDEDGDRSPIAAYCENGAKALAEEATKKIAADADKVKEKKVIESNPSAANLGAGGGGAGGSGWTAAKIDALDEEELKSVPKDIYTKSRAGRR